MLAAGSVAPIINEPFNSKWNPSRKPFEMLYLPPQTGSPAQALQSSQNGFNRILRHELSAWRHPRRYLRAQQSSLIIIRDVHTCLALTQIWQQLQPAILVLIRHPCALADSWQRVGFSVQERITHLLSQPALIDDYLAPFVEHVSSQKDEFSRLGVYWGAVHFVLTRQKQSHPAWQFITHESLCLQPEQAFVSLAASLQISFAQPGREYLRKHNKPLADTSGLFSLDRISASEPGKWRKSLTSTQIRSVLRAVEPFGVLPEFYPMEHY